VVVTLILSEIFSQTLLSKCPSHNGAIFSFFAHLIWKVASCQPNVGPKSCMQREQFRDFGLTLSRVAVARSSKASLST